ncbi:hypothetical protein D0817_20160 [Flavobacterium cupreum]|uniref:Uncharacterized protein n=1 Tax=Flavobacterium cupreum TaxID=2133766 RepID=A0A434A2V7_9FLAO|nr:hypothetical protein D0817_20160 [Flavobacterium cupreum]
MKQIKIICIAIIGIMVTTVSKTVDKGSNPSLSTNHFKHNSMFTLISQDIEPLGLERLVKSFCDTWIIG